MRLKLLTLNLHCFAEEDINQKQRFIAQTIKEYDVDVVFLQEVCQPKDNTLQCALTKEGNYALALQQLLEELGSTYQLYYDPIKIGFAIYEEGLGILSKHPLVHNTTKYISKTREYENWKARKILAYDLIQDNQTITMATTHFGWSDGFEVFEEQASFATESLPSDHLTILAGDFNIIPDSKEYDHLMTLGWHDTLGTDFRYESTFHEAMDVHDNTSRIDYIMTNQPVELLEHEILFTNTRVSDHYGVYMHIKIK